MMTKGQPSLSAMLFCHHRCKRSEDSSQKGSMVSMAVPFSPRPESGPSGTMSTSLASIQSQVVPMDFK
eukprot:Skav211712  [mRNA]  locus=scaffold2852:293250:297994:+ [translate_table: standard]